MEKTNQINKSEPQVFKSPELEVFGKTITHGFFGRQGGCSTNLYQSLNLGLGSDDDPALVKQNRQLIAKAMGVQKDHLATVHQIHSDVVVSITSPWDKVEWENNHPKADAIVTNIEGLAIGALSADCGPVLFADADARIIGSAHAGWKGAQGGILESTINAMEALGARRNKIIAVLGPCISQASYQVGAEFKEIFCKEDPANKRFFIASNKPNHYQFDLKAYIKTRLTHAGVEAKTMAQCTYIEEDNFFSYRRSTHKKEADYGRQIASISLNSI